MYPPALAQLAAALAILLSVIIRSIRGGASWQQVEDGQATADTLRDLTGIMSTDDLQQTFGPPRLEDGIFPVTRNEVRRARTGLGYLFGDRWLDGASALVAIISLMPIWPLWNTRQWLDTLLIFAGAYQAAGWIASMRMIRTR
ncbi:MAG TPA: hypothetical protein PLN33_19670 [Hyphomonadaceae bacterium]|nr:hypothetical protein [Hyphomonadaceae bacterium]HPN07051.1 hypothetical protein [Hyphomonadaceae bacterium]